MFAFIRTVFSALFGSCFPSSRPAADEETCVGTTVEVVVHTYPSPRGTALMRALSSPRRRLRSSSSLPSPPAVEYNAGLSTLLLASCRPGMLDLKIDLVAPPQVTPEAPANDLALVLWRASPHLPDASKVNEDARIALLVRLLEAVKTYRATVPVKETPALLTIPVVSASCPSDTNSGVSSTITVVTATTSTTVDFVGNSSSNSKFLARQVATCGEEGPRPVAPGGAQEEMEVARAVAPGGDEENKEERFPFDAPDMWRGAPRVQVLRVLGQGGCGKVYEVEKKETGKRYALKVMTRSQVADDMFDRERKALNAGGRHWNVVFLKWADKGPQHLFLLLGLAVEGDMLNFASRTELSENDRLRAVLETASALAHLHRQNIVHHDLKVENLFVGDHDGRRAVLLGDLGFAQDVSEGAVTVEWGTLGWRAPEVILGEPHGTGADIWALGIVLLMLWSARDIGDLAHEQLPSGYTFSDLRRRVNKISLEGARDYWFDSPFFSESVAGAEVAGLITSMCAGLESHRPSAVEVCDSLIAIITRHHRSPDFDLGWGYLCGPMLEEEEEEEE